MLGRLTAICLVLLAGAGQAQEQITPEQFLDRATGKTLTFRQFRGGAVVGTEEFLRRDLSVWATETGRCTYGTIRIEEGHICFLYDDYPDPGNCWLPFEYQGDLMVMATRSGETQWVSEITDEPISCEGAPLS